MNIDELKRLSGITENENDNIDVFVKNRKYGWISEDQLIQVNQYDHLQYFLESGMYPEINEAIQQLVHNQGEEIERIEHERSQDPDDDGYGWHVIESHHGAERSALRSWLTYYVYTKGWGRIGTFTKNRVPYFVLECTPEFKKVLSRKSRRIAKQVGREFLLEIVQPYDIQSLPREVRDLLKYDLELI